MEEAYQRGDPDYSFENKDTNEAFIVVFETMKQENVRSQLLVVLLCLPLLHTEEVCRHLMHLVLELNRRRNTSKNDRN